MAQNLRFWAFVTGFLFCITTFATSRCLYPVVTCDCPIHNRKVSLPTLKSGLLHWWIKISCHCDLLFKLLFKDVSWCSSTGLGYTLVLPSIPLHSPHCSFLWYYHNHIVLHKVLSTLSTNREARSSVYSNFAGEIFSWVNSGNPLSDSSKSPLRGLWTWP